MIRHDLLTELLKNNMADKIFPVWLYVNPPNEKAPDFVKWSISIQKDKFAELFEQVEQYANEKGYFRLNILEWKDWKWYCTVDTYKPEQKETKQERKPEQKAYSWINLEDIPF